MVDVKALRELAERWHGAATSLTAYNVAQYDCARELMALLAEDDALPEGWTADDPYDDGYDAYVTYTRSDTDEKRIHDVTVWSWPQHATSVRGDVTATELHAVLSYHLSRKGSDR